MNKKTNILSLSGWGGLGKTSTIKNIIKNKNNYKLDCKFITEIGRSLLCGLDESFIHIHAKTETSTLLQKIFLDYYKLSYMMNKNRNIISDRSIIDVIAYNELFSVYVDMNEINNIIENYNLNIFTIILRNKSIENKTYVNILKKILENLNLSYYEYFITIRQTDLGIENEINHTSDMIVDKYQKTNKLFK